MSKYHLGFVYSLKDASMVAHIFNLCVCVCGFYNVFYECKVKMLLFVNLLVKPSR